jgi:hypothetical protein
MPLLATNRVCMTALTCTHTRRRRRRRRSLNSVERQRLHLAKSIKRREGSL